MRAPGRGTTLRARALWLLGAFIFLLALSGCFDASQGLKPEACRTRDCICAANFSVSHPAKYVPVRYERPDRPGCPAGYQLTENRNAWICQNRACICREPRGVLIGQARYTYPKYRSDGKAYCPPNMVLFVTDERPFP